MNHNDNNRVPNFYSLADQEQGHSTEQAWAPYPAKTNKKKSKKKAKSHAVEEYPEVGGQEDVTAAQVLTPPQLDTMMEEDVGAYGVNQVEFTPDQLALDNVDIEPASWPQRNSYNDSPAPTTDEGQWIEPSPPPRKTVESPRLISSKPAPYATSPPVHVSAPYGSPNSHGNFEEFKRPTPKPARTASRRESFPTQSSPAQRFVEPKAPPHMAQPHFYGLPTLDLNLGLAKQESDGKTAGTNGYCCCFDSFADCGDGASARKAKDALLVGSEGGLEVFRILSNKVEVVGRLEGLPGSVVGAKILPHVDVDDRLQLMRPLVAVTVHSVAEGENSGSELRHKASAEFYQTSVEVYSLRSQQHIATLYRSSPVSVHRPNRGESTLIREHVEDLTVIAQGKFIIIASGKSGEVFVFSDVADAARNEPDFRCIGKVWTSLQIPLEKSSSRPPSASGSEKSTQDISERAGAPLLSLGQRWLAIVPPSTSSHVSIQGFPLLSESNPSPPGLASAVAPPQPQVTSEVTGVDVEDAWSRLTRQAAQGMVKYSQKGIDLGWQGWKELTTPAPQTTQQHGSKERDVLFPPTKALPEDPLRLSKEPAMVSILDLEALLHAEATRSKYPPTSLASFPLSDGCNFLSFSTSGVQLLAVSRKGELSSIWDLTQCCHGRSITEGRLGEHSPTSGPRVKLIHSIPRSSPAMVVDCAWSRDDDNIAVLTAHGTVHLHEVPIRPSRKRKRRETGTSPSTQKSEPTVSVSQGMSPPSSNAGFLGSIKSGWQQMSTQVTSLRASSSNFGIPTSFAGFRDATTSVGSAGGRALARGLSQGLSAAKGGASDYWHADDNKIRHKALQEAKPRVLKWIKRQSDLFLAVVCQGVVHLHPVQQTHRRKGDVLVSGLRHDKYGLKHFELPSIRTRAGVDEGDTVALAAQQGLHGFWSLRNSDPVERRESTGALASVQTNEVETNPPYCPFHVDSRVDIFTFESAEDDDPFGTPERDTNTNNLQIFHTHGHGNRKAPSWLFGEPLPPSTKVNTHDDLDYMQYLSRRESELDSDLGEGDLEDQVKSFLTIRPAEDDEGDLHGMKVGINIPKTPSHGEVDGFDTVDDL